MKKLDIKMIGLDLDGTVFNDDKVITEHTKEVLAKAIRQGVVVLPATGRPESGLPQQFLEIPGVRYAVTSNGARVIDLKTAKTVVEEMISWDVALQVIRYARTWENTAWEVYFDGKAYVEEGEYHFIDHPDIKPVFKQYILDTRKAQRHLLETIEKEKIGLEKIRMSFPDTEYRNQCMKAFEEKFPYLDISYATTFDMDIVSKNIGKGVALLKLGKILGIEQDQIMACGDAKNDWIMLDMAGFAVAMGNADEETKKRATYVTLTNEEDGVAYAVEKFVLT